MDGPMAPVIVVHGIDNDMVTQVAASLSSHGSGIPMLSSLYRTIDAAINSSLPSSLAMIITEYQIPFGTPSSTILVIAIVDIYIVLRALSLLIGMIAQALEYHLHASYPVMSMSLTSANDVMMPHWLLDESSMIKRLARTAYQYWEYAVAYDQHLYDRHTNKMTAMVAATGTSDSSNNNGFGYSGWAHYKVASYLLYGTLAGLALLVFLASHVLCGVCHLMMCIDMNSGTCHGVASHANKHRAQQLLQFAYQHGIHRAAGE